MSSPKKTKKGKRGAKKKGAKKGGGGIGEVKKMLEVLKKELDSLRATVKKQNKRISALETENKRTKKNLRNMQLNLNGNGLSNGTLIVPKQSDDILASDVEVKEDDQYTDELKEKEAVKSSKKSKKDRFSKNKYNKKTKKDKIIQKPKPKPKKLKFSFDLNHQKITSNDGQSCAKPKSIAGTIRFGRFANYDKNNKDDITSYTIIFDTRSIGQNSSVGIGFITNSFNQTSGSNFGENNSCIVKGNGQFLNTERTFKTIDGKQYPHKKVIDSILNDNKAFFKDGEDVAIKLDLQNFMGFIWNDTLNKNGENKEKVFEIQLPKDYEIAIGIYMTGSQKKKLFVKDQSFTFIGQEQESNDNDNDAEDADNETDE